MLDLENEITSHGARVRKRMHQSPWVPAHVAAWDKSAVKPMLVGLAIYAQRYAENMGCVIAEDYVFGPAWLSILENAHELLNGDTGKLNCGEVSKLMNDLAKLVGFSEGLGAVYYGGDS